LFGEIEGNEDLLKPLFYLSARIAPKPLEYIAELIGFDARFFGVNTENFNYNANNLLVGAIAGGERGAYWMLLSNIIDRQTERELTNGQEMARTRSRCS
jgi:tryptophan 2-C-methyltransferase